MSSFAKLNNIIKNKNSILCVGLDTDINKLPKEFDKNINSMLEFNRTVIDNTKEYAASFKLNFAFYEQYGAAGFDILKQTISYIGDDAFIIADAKRGDIGNTSSAYAFSCFEELNADSITVAPYMGYDSVEPFLRYKDKMTFILALTSNPGSNDFQRLEFNGNPLYINVIEKCTTWSDETTLGFVAGATYPNDIAEIRELIPNHFLLIPGVGTQGGNIEDLLKANSGGPCLINVSRDIIYTDSSENYAESIKFRAKYYRDEFNKWI